MVTCGLPGPTGPAGDEVTAEDLPALRAAGTRLIDIRESAELAEGMIRGAEHVPMGELLSAVGAGDGGGGDSGADGGGADGGGDEFAGAVLYCAAGSRSASAQRVLADRGIAVRSLRGGFAEVPEAEIEESPGR